MSGAANAELLSFAAQVLEEHGAAVEQQTEHLMALLPPELARSLDLSTEERLGGEGQPILYGSPLLERLVRLATGEASLLYGRIDVPYLKQSGFEQLVDDELAFEGTSVRLTGRGEVRIPYLILVCHYVALSDERREGLVQVAVNEESGAIVEEMQKQWSEFRSDIQPHFFQPGDLPPHFPAAAARAVESALAGARTVAEAELSDFLESMRRRLRRDAKNTREYYEALQAEMEADLERRNLSAEQQEERRAKAAGLPGEMARKIEDLHHKYRVQISIRGCAALRLLVPVSRLTVELSHRHRRRTIHLSWNPVTRRIDPLACERCHTTTRRLHPRPQDPEIQLVCPRCEEGGTIASG